MSSVVTLFTFVSQEINNNETSRFNRPLQSRLPLSSLAIAGSSHPSDTRFTEVLVKRDIIELRQAGNLWVVTHNGNALVYAPHREVAISVAAGALLEVTAKAEEVELRGLTLSELLPARAAESTSERLPSKIDFTEAKRLAKEDSFAYYEAETGSPIAVVDDLCEQYEWGWIIRWRPIETVASPSCPSPKPFFPIPVDRVTGNVGHSGGTHGIERGIIELLQRRPDDLRGPYPTGRQRWLTVLNEFKKAGAFTPIKSASSGKAPIEETS